MKTYLKLDFLLLLLMVTMSTSVDSQIIVGAKLGSCDANAEVDLVQSRIVAKEIIGNQLKLTIGFVENCCYTTDLTATLKNDTLFLKKSNASEIVCSCLCCFELELVIDGVSDTNFVLVVNGSTFYAKSKYMKLPHEYTFDNDAPINQLNAKQQKIGLWRVPFPNSRKIELEEFYVQDETGHYLAWSRRYDKKGNLVFVHLYKSADSYDFSFDAEEYQSLIKRL